MSLAEIQEAIEKLAPEEKGFLMTVSKSALPEMLRLNLASSTSRTQRLQQFARSIRGAGPFRWVGLYDVDRVKGEVVNLVWDGPGPPEFPVFPITKGLTGSAIANQSVVNVGNVGADARYLTAFGSTQSESELMLVNEIGVQKIGTQ